jgi:hypothetical protein
MMRRLIVVRRRGAWTQALPLFQKPPKRSFTTRAATHAADKLRASLSEPQLIAQGSVPRGAEDFPGLRWRRSGYWLHRRRPPD